MQARQRWTMLAAVLGSSVVFLDGTVVNVALPKIGQELPATILGVLEGQTYVNTGYLAILAALLILGGALSDRYGRKRVFSIGLVGFGIASVLCGLAPEPRGARPGPAPPGSHGGPPRPRFAGPDHLDLRGSGAGPRVRRLGRGDVGGDPARAGRRRARRPGPDLAARVPDQRPADPAGPPRPGAGHAGDDPRGRQRPVRLARLARRRPLRRRSVVRAHPRPAAQLGRPDRLGGDRDRDRRRDRLPVPDVAPARPARPAEPVPDPPVRGDQPGDVPDLRRALRLPRLPSDLPPGDPGLHGDRGRDRRPPGRDPADRPVDPGRQHGRPLRPAPVPRRRAAAHGGRPGLVRPGAGRRARPGSST